MEVYETMLKRRSIRKFTEEPVKDEYVDKLLHAAMSGPSACNKTPWDFYVIKDKEVLKQLHGSSRYANIESPLAIVVCGNLSRALPQPIAEYWVQDCSAATENILLEATELGLGSVWCGIYPKIEAQNKVSEILQLDNNMIPLNIIYIGHPSEEQPARDQYNCEYVHMIG